jgi:hypothetical protein
MPQALLRYRFGQEIKKGDRVLFHGNPAQIEFVACERDSGPEIAWYVKEFGGGVMVLDPTVSGCTFLTADSLAECEDLEFVSGS